MARLSKKAPYSKIKIFDTEYVVQFKTIEKEHKTECLIFTYDEDTNDYPLFVRGVSKCIAEDVKDFDVEVGKKISFDKAMIKLEASMEKAIEFMAIDTRNKFTYFEDQLSYKCFKK